MESNLLKEAIADAKAVRQTALANAKVALEEQFQDKYEELLSKKLSEDTDSFNPKGGNQIPHEEEEEENITESEIDELIKELEEEVEEGDEAAPDPTQTPPPAAGQVPQFGAGMPTQGAGAAGCPPCPPMPGAVPGLPGQGGAGQQFDQNGMPIQGMDQGMGQGVDPNGMPIQQGAGTGAVPETTPPTSGAPTAEEEEQDEIVSLDELLANLKGEAEEEEEEEEDECKSLDEAAKLASSAIGGNKAGGSANKKPSTSAHNSSRIESGGKLKSGGYPAAGTAKVGPCDATEASRPNSDADLSTPNMGGSNGTGKTKRPNSTGKFENTPLHEENRNLKLQLNEAEQTIRYVKGQLNEINLLNAKLLYTNKLFKEYGMNNDQKMRVVEMFDLSKNVREVKLTYANIAESLNFSGNDMKRTVKKQSAAAQSITEGLASRPVGSTKPSRELISEGKANQMVTRFQQIAGIKSTKK